MGAMSKNIHVYDDRNAHNMHIPFDTMVFKFFLIFLFKLKNHANNSFELHWRGKQSVMKKTGLLAAIILPLLIILAAAPKAHAQDVVVSYQTFYDELSPYGQWVYDGQYGNVWVPEVGPGFRPYASNGHWVMTDNGNMWVSEVPWAWACYHYGRWTYDGYYGWVWVPGHEWAPAWVNWRSGGGYYGWAPMGPGHVFGGSYEYPDNYWVFVSPNYLYHPAVYSYYERGDAVVYVHQTSYIRYEGNDHYYYGPRREAIERETRQPVQIYRVSDARQPGTGRMDGNQVTIYRPAISESSMRFARPANVAQAREHPIGRGEPVTAARPAFRQEHTQQQYQQQNQQQTRQQQMQPQGQPARQQMQSQQGPRQFQSQGAQQQRQPQRQAPQSQPRTKETHR